MTCFFFKIEYFLGLFGREKAYPILFLFESDRVLILSLFKRNFMVFQNFQRKLKILIQKFRLEKHKNWSKIGKKLFKIQLSRKFSWNGRDLVTIINKNCSRHFQKLKFKCVVELSYGVSKLNFTRVFKSFYWGTLWANDI